MRPMRVLFRLVATGAALGLAGCDQDLTSPANRPAAGAPVRVASVPDNVVLQWNNAALQAIRVTKPGPPIVARALAIVHTAMYDAWAAYDHQAVGTRLGGTLRRPPVERTLVNKSKAVSFAAYRALVDLFPTQTSPFNVVMASLGYDPANHSTDVATPAGVGNVAAAAVITFRHHDGANQQGDLHPGAYSDYTGYVPVNDPDHINDPNRWQPLRFSDGHGGTVTPGFIAPHWGRVAPFALTSGSQFRPREVPNRYPFGGYRVQAEQILHYSKRLTDTQKAIAEYWADGPNTELPPGHWMLFGQFVSRRDGHTLDQDVKLFFALANAVFDAGIVAWDCKRFYDYVRPVTAVHFLFAGKKIRAWAGPYRGTRVIDGADWEPYQPVTFVTPPFPEFTSGHSTFSAAGAEILKSFTGSDAFGASATVRAGSSKVEPGAVPATDVRLSWATFSDAAAQAGISRRYGGIHFVQGDLRGRSGGRLVGAQVWAKALTYFNGTATP
jgi:uncharacterized protein DUF6851/vanadium-dependent haloperoxidase-like protein